MRLKNLGLEGATSIDLITAATAKMKTEDLAATLIKSGLNHEEQVAILQKRGLIAEIAEETLATAADTVAKEVDTAATGGLTAATGGLAAAFKGLWATMAANPILVVITVLASLAAIIYKVKQANDEAKQAAKERHEQEIQTAKDSVEKHNQELKSMQDVVAEYSKYKDVTHLTSQEKERLMEIQQSLIDKYGSEAESIDLINGKYDEQIAKLQQLTIEAAKANSSNLSVLLDEAKKKANDNISPNYTYGESVYSAITDNYGNKSVLTELNEDYQKLADFINKYEGLEGEIAYHSQAVMGQTQSWANLEFNLTKDTSANMAANAKQALDDLEKFELNLENQELVNSAAYKEMKSWLNQQYEHYSAEADEVANAYNEMAENIVLRFTSTINGKSYNMYNLNSSVFSEWKEQLLEPYQKVDPELANAIEKYLSNNYSEWVNIANQQANDKLNKIRETFADGLIKRMAQAGSDPKLAQNSIDSFANWLDSLPEEQKTVLLNIDFDNSEIDFSQFGISDWQEYLDENFEHTLYDKLSEDFFESVDTYKDKVTDLKGALEDFEKGDFSNDDLYELQKKFPELIGHTDDFDVVVKKLLDDMNSDMIAEFNAQFGKLNTEEDKRKLEEFMKTVLELGQVVGSTEFSIDIEAETQGMEDFYTAVKESASATGLSAKSIENLKERYKNLFKDNPEKKQELLNKLFERSEHGIHLNVAALRELESEYEKSIKEDFQKQIKDLTGQYNDLTEQINECSDVSQKAQLYAKRQEVLDQLNDVADLAAQYEGLTSAFNKWLEAQDTPDEDDMFQKLSSGLEDIKTLFEEGRVGVDDFREAVQMMTDVDMSTASIEELLAMYDSGIGTMEKFFTGNGEGLQDFLDMLVSVSTQAGETWATVDQFGNYEFDFGVGDDSKITEAINNMTEFQMSTEEVQILLRALSAYGFDINLDSIFSKFDLLETDFETLQDLVDEANQKLIEVGATEYKFNINTDDVEDLNTQFGEIYQTILDMYDDNGELNVKYNEEDLQSAKDILSALISQKESLNDACVMKIDTTTADDDIHNVIGKLQSFQTAYSIMNSLVAIGADTTEAQAEVDYWREEILKTDTPMLASLQLDNTSVAAMYESINEITPEMLVKAGLDETEVQAFIDKDKDSEATVTCDVDDSEVEKFLNKNHDTDAKVIYNVNADAVWNFINNLHNESRTVQYDIYYNHHGSASAQANGTANANGTAFRQGDWGTKDSGTALMGELGTEMIVRNGRWFTVGDDGAGFYQYKKGDIIFNHKQVQELFKNGKVTSGGGRGQVFADGTAFSSGSGRIHGKGSVNTNPSNGSSGGGSNGSSSSSSSEKEITYEKIDWVEIALDRISRTVDKLKRKAESIYSTLSTRNKNLSKEIGTVRQEIERNLAGAERYAKEAWNVGLRADLAEKVRNGTIDITEYDSDTAKKIEEYRKWYQAYLDCQEAAEELQETLKGLYKEKFDNAVTDWTNKLEIYAHTIDRIVSQIELRTAKASKYVSPDNAVTASKANIKDYKKVINNEKKELKQLEKERNDLTSLMWEAVYNGNIAIGSEAYYEMLKQIQDVENEIDSLNQEIVENTNNLAAEFENIFNSISSKYENILSYSEKVSQKYTAQMELTEAKGLMASTYYYNQLRAQEQQNLKNLEAERKKLQEALNQAVLSGTIKVGSEAWYEMKGAIQEVDNEIINTTKDIVEYGNQIRQIQWDRFDMLQEKIKNVRDETSFLIDLLSNSELYTDKGQLTDEGLSTLGLYAVDYNVLMSQANDYADEIKKLQKEMAKDPMNTDLIERYEELISKQQEAIKSAESQKQSIKKLVADGIKAELSSLKDLISAYNESLEAEKSLYDYQKKVSEQTKNIANLQKQLSAYENDTSEETRSKLQKLRVELGEAQEQLQETQYDKYISDQKKLLDNLYSDYESILNARLDDLDQLISDMINVTNQNSGTITETLKDVTDKVGYTVTDEMGKIWNGSSRNIVQVYGDRFDKRLTTVNTTLSTIANNLNTLVSGGNTFASTGGKRAYATGIKRIPQNQWAWTQEDSPETIIRPSDGAILTPLKVGDSVLNGMATANLYDMMNDPSKFIRDSLFEGQSVANGANVSNTSNMSSINLENVNFNLPNVKNYDEFIYAMQHDAKFEKFIRSISTDRIFGGSSLKKYRTM